MAKSRKKKVGVHKKVASVFEGVIIPEREGEQDSCNKRASEGSHAVQPGQALADSLISKSSQRKKVPRSKASADKTLAGHVNELFREMETPESPALQDSSAEPFDHTDVKPDKAARDRTGDVPSTPKSIEHPIPPRPSKKKRSKSGDASDKSAPGRIASVPPKLTAPEPPTPELTLAKESPQTTDLSDKIEPDREAEVPLPLTTPDQPVKPPSSEPEAEHASKPVSKTAPEREPDDPSQIKSLDDPEAKDAPQEESGQVDKPSSQSGANQTDDVLETTLNRLIPQSSSQGKHRRPESVPGGAIPSQKKRVPPKSAVPDHPMTEVSSETVPERAEDRQVETEAAGKVDKKPISRPAAEHRSSPGSLMSRLSRDETTSDAGDSSHRPEVSPAPKRVKPPALRGAATEKRYRPEVPPTQPAARAQRETPAAAEPKGPSRQQQVSEKLFAPKAGVSAARQKVMVLLIPILAIILIFLFRQVLSKPPHKTKGDDAKDAGVAVLANPAGVIDWKVPDPLPPITRDPTKLPAQSDAPPPDEEPNEPVETPKIKLINVGTIVFSRDKASAIVNGRIVHDGDIVNGVTIVRIDQDSIQCEKDGEKWVEKVRD
jgi:hypothetical protein